MSLWWLQPGWHNALCAGCGVNIWYSGGDPDHGVCYECFMERAATEQEPSYQCEICNEHDACASVNGFCVCSEECGTIAEGREPKAVTA
jgi:hypothetical protein